MIADWLMAPVRFLVLVFVCAWLPTGCSGARKKQGAPAEVGHVAADNTIVPSMGSNERSMDAAAAKGAARQLEVLRAMPAEMLEPIVAGGRPDAEGAVGHNRGSWMGAQYQRSAAMYFLFAASRNDRGAAEDAWRAFEFVFSHQQADGGFGPRNESGSPSAMKDVYSDVAFWLAQFSQAALVMRASPLTSTFETRFAELLPKIRRAASLLVQGKDALTTREASATNRYFIDALAYELTGLLLRDDHLVESGSYFVNLGLKKQTREGFFEEAGGSDSSYNCVSILMLQVHDLYFPSAETEAALAKAVRWELQRVKPTGEIDVADNTRTGVGRERYFGQSKEVNYLEANLAFLYFGGAHADHDALDAALRVHGWQQRKR